MEDICSTLHMNTGRVLQAIQLLSSRNKARPDAQTPQLFITCVAVLHTVLHRNHLISDFVDLKATFSSQRCVTNSYIYFGNIFTGS